MIPVGEAARLHVGLRGLLPAPRAEAVLALAGRLTADYLLANRIPGFVQTILKLLPSRLAASALMRAISANSWTFGGGGRFSYKVGAHMEARIESNPLCSGLHAEKPACVWHAAVFERLFRALVAPSTRARETACCAHGNDCCRFQLQWSAKSSSP
jgi:divinyl protochlorophyllide a 8-vinyl-reductase